MSARHVRRGTMKVLWVDAVADRAEPTIAELEGGIDLSAWVAGMAGWEVERTPVPLTTDDLTGAVISVEGYQRTVDVPTLQMYDEGTGTAAAEAALSTGAAGVVVFCLDGAPAAGDRAQVWPVVSCGPQHVLTAALEAATWRVVFALWAPPTVDAVIAA